MNTTDSLRVLEQLKKIISENPKVPVLAFDSTIITGVVRNVKHSKLIYELNDLFSATKTCIELGTVFTVCSYDHRTWFLIRANAVLSLTPHFNQDLLTF